MQREFLQKAYEAAVAAHHPFPEIAACEAALESGWGGSQLAVQGNNLFGRKVWHEGDDVLVLPTLEFLRGQWVTLNAEWAKFPSWAACFADRVHVLTTDKRYAAAMQQTDPVAWIEAVSKVWSTDPLRSTKVLATYHAHKSCFPPTAA
ncbi:MAG: glucosaminidase domain-containing protein [Acidobacteriaceae bacterium]